MDMMEVLRRLRHLLQEFGVDGQRFLASTANLPKFVQTLQQYRQAAGDDPFGKQPMEFFPILSDFAAQAGTAGGHYFHQDIWAARKIHVANPALHIDIGSRIDGFVAHLLTFMPVTVIDIRPLKTNAPGLTFIQSDATELAGIQDNSVGSLSCLHAVEHFGLGRYGDAVDPEACFCAMRTLARVVRPGGRLYFSVPIGRQRISFNAHRVFAPQTVLDTLQGLELVDFSAVNDKGDFVQTCRPEDFTTSHFACGLFEFTKR